jgi:hypothetical protein
MTTETRGTDFQRLDDRTIQRIRLAFQHSITSLQHTGAADRRKASKDRRKEPLSRREGQDPRSGRDRRLQIP